MTERVAAGLVIASLGGGELALREHLAGYRSHSTLLAGVAAFVAVTAVALGLGPVKLWLLAVVGVAVFGAALYAMRELFKRRSGGLGFRSVALEEPPADRRPAPRDRPVRRRGALGRLLPQPARDAARQADRQQRRPGARHLFFGDEEGGRARS